jgi:hypothetical protein
MTHVWTQEDLLRLSLQWIFLAILLPVAVLSHTGDMALAVPLHGIVVDGDLSDWPEGMRQYAIDGAFSENPLFVSGDLKGVFRVGYNTEENALFFAVEVEDDSVIPESADHTLEWNTQETCEIYLQVSHAGKIPSIICGVRP